MNEVDHAVTGDCKGRSYNSDYMKVGKLGEEVVLRYLKQHPSIVGVVDFRSVREIQEADVDCGVKLYTGQVCLAEIKTDTYLGVSGNFVNELLRINHYSQHQFAGYLGWTLRSPAHYLFVYAPNRKPPAIYKTTFEKIRAVLQGYSKENQLRFGQIRTDSVKTTYVCLIALDEYPPGTFEIIENFQI